MPLCARNLAQKLHRVNRGHGSVVVLYSWRFSFKTSPRAVCTSIFIMAITLHEVHARLKEKKAKKRDMNSMVNDQLSVHPRYQEIVEEMTKLREEKKAIENELRTPSDVQEIEALKMDIRGDHEMLADIALNLYIANEPVEILDEYNVKWVPVFAVRFKRD